MTSSSLLSTSVTEEGHDQAAGADKKPSRKLGDVLQQENYSFYDDLRRSPTASFRPVKEPEPSQGRALHIVSDPTRLGNNVNLTLCHIPIFLRYSMFSLEADEFLDVSSLSYGGTAGALLAMHHFNTGDGSIVDELRGINERCNIRFTTEVVDTQSSQIVALQNLAGDFITARHEEDIEKPQACAIMGAAWSTVSQYMATVSGVYDLLQVSPSSSSMSLDSITQYPLFSRTHASDEAKGRLAVEYFDKVLGISNFGILFVNSESNIALQETVRSAAAERNMMARSVSFPEDSSADLIRNALVQLKESGLNYFLGVFFPLRYDYIMEIAADVGVAGPGKFWLVTGHLAEFFAGENTTITTGSNADIGSTGLGILHDDGGPGLPHYENFFTHWKKIEYNQEALDYINSKQPGPPPGTNMSFERQGEYFSRSPSHYAQFSYDAIAGMGIAACRAANESTFPDNYFTGKRHHEMFLRHPFVGATGNVSFDSNSFSRDGSSVYYFVSEINEIDRPTSNTSILSGKTSVYFDPEFDEWRAYPGARKFVYSDGSTVPPAELPPYSEDTNSVTNFVKVTCLVLATIGMLSSIGLAVFVFVKRNNQVIRSSQPPFLYILCVGTLVMSNAIIPLIIDDSIADEAGCSIACMARIWLVSIGFTITFSALYSKTLRINRLLRMSRGFIRVKLTPADVMVPFFVLFLMNVLILSLWTALAPLQWSRTALQNDTFGRQVKSVGGCYNEEWLPYGIALFLVNGTALLLAIWEAYKARNITTGFSESQYIAMAVVCIFQALFVGVPLFFATKELASAQAFVMSAMIFICCMAVLLLIFVPKMMLIYKCNSDSSSQGTSSTRRASFIHNTRTSANFSFSGNTAETATRNSVSSIYQASVAGLDSDTNANVLQSCRQVQNLEELESPTSSRSGTQSDDLTDAATNAV